MIDLIFYLSQFNIYQINDLVVLFNFNVLFHFVRFTNAFRGDYKGVGMMGFNVWEQNKHCRSVRSEVVVNDLVLTSLHHNNRKCWR